MSGFSICFCSDYNCSWNCNLDFFSSVVADFGLADLVAEADFLKVILNMKDCVAAVVEVKVIWSMGLVGRRCLHLRLFFHLQTLLF